MSKEQRQSLKLWKPGSFDAYKNAIAPMIAMLDCSELDMKVSDAGIESMESNDCRGILLWNTLDTNIFLFLLSIFLDFIFLFF